MSLFSFYCFFLFSLYWIVKSRLELLVLLLTWWFKGGVVGKIDPHSWYCCKCIYWDHNCVLKQSYYLNVARPYLKHVFKNKLLHISLINGLFFIICGCLSCLQSQCLHRVYQLQKFHFTARYISKRQNDKHQLNFMLVLIKRIPYH